MAWYQKEMQAQAAKPKKPPGRGRKLRRPTEVTAEDDPFAGDADA